MASFLLSHSDKSQALFSDGATSLVTLGQLFNFSKPQGDGENSLPTRLRRLKECLQSTENHA